ncbi:MAG: hypothetical protein A2298_00975 [Gammaproteobacteria bacterium RIFOXYB2_FULL_38_6]|nr:MAG: hypothetical protein A2298_00975 [Gammaproteobacteria bacterium RIFOXYB2_FULL_38_6]
MKKLYVGNLPYSIRDEELAALFAPHGEVVSAKVIVDKFSNRSKGFGFVEMASDEAAKAAQEALDGKDFQGRGLKVNIARPEGERSSGNGGGRRGPGGSGGFRHRNNFRGERSERDDRY